MSLARLLVRTLLILLVLLAVIGLILPENKVVTRSLDINASPSKVFPHINSMRAFHAWSPWAASDPKTLYQFEGPVSGVGSRMVWNSDAGDSGKGSQEIIRSELDQLVASKLDFGGESILSLSANSHGGTLVTWRFKTQFGWDIFGRYVGLMLDSMIGSSYTKGLKTLKQRVENT